MTPAEKAKETRRLHEEQRKTKELQRKTKELEEKQTKEIMTAVLLSVLKSCQASIDQKLEAVSMLIEIKGW